MRYPKTNLVLSALFLFICGFKAADNIIARLGMEQQNARHYIMSNLLGNFEMGPTDDQEEDNGDGSDYLNAYRERKSFRLPYARLLPSIISGDKTGAARELCAYIKMYVNSQEFMEDYVKRKDATKPTSEPWRPDTETINSQRQSIKEMEKQVADMKKNKQMQPEIIASFENSLVNQKKQLAQWEDPTPNKTRWENSFPADPSPVIRKRLQDYLTLVATVDFSAQLTAPDKYKIRKFVNPELEKKSLKWKACFRAGKEVNDVVTAFVKEWLKGEIISKEKIKMPDYKTPATDAGQTSPPVTTRANETKTDSLAKPVKDKKNLLNKLKRATGF